MASIPASLDYLDHLRTEQGDPITYRRIDSVKVYTDNQPQDDWLTWLGFRHRPGPILDKYEITTPTQTIILWVNPYAHKMPVAPPDGFMLDL